MIRVEGLCLWHKDRPILREVGFRVGPDETLAILGESGGGKTSIARLLMGLLPGQGGSRRARDGFRWCGTATVAGMDMINTPEPRLRLYRGAVAGLIPQALAYALNPQMTVADHLRETLHVHGLRKPLDTICREWNIPVRLLTAYPVDLSGGEIQRVLTALAMIPDPPCLILDEPTASLDPVSRNRTVEAIWRDGGKRCRLLFTHDIDLAGAVANRVAVLRRGTLVESGPALQLLSKPRHPYTRKLIAAGRALARGAPPVFRGAVVRGEGLVVDGLRHRSGGRCILPDLSCRVPKGNCLAVLGPSGSGKSTFARLLAGLEPVQAGRITWREGDREAHPRVGFVSQMPHRALARHFTVSEVLEEALRFQPDDQRTQVRYSTQISDLLDRVGLPTTVDFLARQTPALSGGEAQRLVIARALVGTPDMIVADEPTAALDMNARARIIALLRQLQVQRGLTLVVMTHDRAVARSLADAELHLGRPAGPAVTQPRDSSD